MIARGRGVLGGFLASLSVGHKLTSAHTTSAVGSSPASLWLREVLWLTAGVHRGTLLGWTGEH